MKPANPPVFPVLMQAGDRAIAEGGITLLDLFAAHALSGLTANPPADLTIAETVSDAYAYARAMLEERAVQS